MSKSNLVIRQPHQEQIEFTRPILVLAQVPGNVVQHGAVHDLAAFNTRATWLDGYMNSLKSCLPILEQGLKTKSLSLRMHSHMSQLLVDTALKVQPTWDGSSQSWDGCSQSMSPWVVLLAEEAPVPDREANEG